jgi:WD40 repeat protein
LANHNVRPLNSQVSFLTPIKTQSIAQGAMSQSGAWMLTQDGDRRALLWRLPAAATEPPPRPLELPGKVIAKAAFGPAERWLVTLTEDGSGYLWDLSRPPVTEPAQPLARQEPIRQAQFDANGRWLAAHEENGRQVRVWALPDGNALPAAPRLLPPEAGEDHPVVTAMAFDHAGRWLATGRDDGKLALWNLTALDAGAASRPVILAGARGRVTAVHFTPDGARLLAAIALNGGEENYFLWPLTLPRLAQQACAQLNGRSFSPAEWETYFPTRPYRETCPVE